ncbi:acetamidase/formamidase family protein [Siccirubricoccus sp. KC 17139]|uniref:Acetamidase/formamidase family protein n=1 Tax=Siccirubricoccus soli TaxID=2899147 RepID=A0ABT1CY64_9PROT|nr:acetamidase/formamidase family protein [Siccirubricoccus soli]MCO6414603.1 acetamidase/formamidase family protein [Siccirubricoccus soli]MCP2680733.1 acetamidase/formamidase family protein [Siccirubricoccus soli]
MATHTLRATPETVRLGVFDAIFPPVLTIASGDTVAVECLSGRPGVLPEPGSGLTIPPALAAIVEANPGMTTGHICTGPIAIEGAMPGDMLEIRIESIEPGSDWGWNMIRPLAGTLPEDFHEPHLMVIPIDRTRKTCRLPWGTELPLAPFFGVMGVAPPPAFGRVSSKEPRIHGGNLDNRQLQQGSTLFLPVHVPGANFSVGDGHGVQGDGEVCVTALETCLDGVFTFVLHKAEGGKPALAYPRAETPTHFISMGLHEDLDQAMKTALREMIAFITARTNLSPEQAYAFCSLAVDFHVTQTVNGEKGVHGLLKKGLLF